MLRIQGRRAYGLLSSPRGTRKYCGNVRSHRNPLVAPLNTVSRSVEGRRYQSEMAGLTDPPQAINQQGMYNIIQLMLVSVLGGGGPMTRYQFSIASGRLREDSHQKCIANLFKHLL